MTKTFDEICRNVLGETLMSASQPTQPQKPGQPQQQPAPAGGAVAAINNNQQQKPAPIDQARLKAITDSLTKIQDPAHLEAVEKLLSTLTAPKPGTPQQPAA